LQFVQKMYSENVLHVRHDVWDVHTDVDRWWVITDPDRANDAQCQQAGLAAFGDLRKLPTEKPHELLRRDSAERGQEFAQRILDRQIAD
jgi:hypothetical protein